MGKGKRSHQRLARAVRNGSEALEPDQVFNGGWPAWPSRDLSGTLLGERLEAMGMDSTQVYVVGELCTDPDCCGVPPDDDLYPEDDFGAV